MGLDVTVKIDLVKPVGTLGWGYPLILSKGTAVEYTECASLQEVAAAGFAAANGETPASATYAAAEIMFSQKNPPAKIAVCGLATITAETLETIRGKGWRQVVTVGEFETADKTAVKTFVGTTNNYYFAGVSAASEIASLAGESGSGSVVAIVHSSKAELAAAAVAAEAAGNEVGSFTYKNLVITGVEAEEYTTAALKAVHDAHGIAIVSKIGHVVTSEGFATNGEYMDILDTKNYVAENLEYKTQEVLINMGKIPYDNTGITILENIAVDVMKDAYNRGMIATDEEGNPMYSVSYALRSEVEASDIAARKYAGGKFAFTASGAIHDVDINGEILVA